MCLKRHRGIEMRPFMKKAAICAMLPALFAFLTACSMVGWEETTAPDPAGGTADGVCSQRLPQN